MSYTFTRESAAERLQISTRTLDRHVKAGKIRSKKQGKVLYLHEDDIRDLSTPLWELQKPTDSVRKSTSSKNTPLKDEIIFFDETPVETRFRRKPVMVDYRDLYEDSLRRIGDKDRVIQDLSYRAGQAESELKNSIPMIEYKKTTFLLESAKSKTEEDYRVSLEKTEKLTQEVESSKFIVYVLASLVVILLAVAATLTLFIF